jgi:hypothetical protein
VLKIFLNSITDNFSVKKNIFLMISSINIPDQNLTKRLVISLTSFPPRFNDLHLVLISLADQDKKADRIILWVNEKDAQLLPAVARKVAIDRGIDIHTINTVRDLKAAKKILPTLLIEPNSVITTCDDDVIYPKNWLSGLWESYISFEESCVVCHRARLATLINRNEFEEYRKWTSPSPGMPLVSMQVFPTGIGGVLYPPSCFHDEVLNTKLMLDLCPNNDDIWLFFMSTIAGTKKIYVGKGFYEPTTIPGTQETALWKENVVGGMNDLQLKNMISYFGSQFTEKFQNN